MMMAKLNLKDIVDDTYSNASGTSLAIQLEPFLENEKQVEISLSDSTPISSSFFNSSFGHLIEKHGYEKIKSLIKITGVRSTQARILRNFFDGYKNLNFG